MNRIKKIFLFVHLVLWILFILLVGSQMANEGDKHWVVVTIGFIITDLYIFYSHFYLLTLYLGKNKKQAYLLRLAGIIISGPLIFAFAHFQKPDSGFFSLDHYLMGMVTIVPVFLLLSWLARVTENLVLNTVKKEQLEKYAIATELSYLKAQINPHFLFNTLNNIHTLVYKQAPTAPEAVLRLSSLMRYMIYESNAPFVPLFREMEYLQDYISLQQLRYKKSPVVNLQITGGKEMHHVAPLLFIDLIENAYKHSPARLEPGDIKVHLDIKGDKLSFEVQNPFVKNLQRQGISKGIGLANARKRLALLYPDKHSLTVTSTEDTFIIKLNIEGLKMSV